MEPQKRSKQRNIIIGVVITLQVIISLLFLMFAVYQKAEADKVRLIADKQSLMAEAMSKQQKVAYMKAQKKIDSLTMELEKLKVLVEKK